MLRVIIPARGGAMCRRPIVAFEGELGAFSCEAIERWFSGGAAMLPQRDAARVIAALERGAASHAVLPIVNSLAGEVRVDSWSSLMSSAET